MIPKECKRLAEVDFPIAEVSKHSAREKSIRHGHPSTLHLWWARRPLAACRSILLALLLPDPADKHCPEEFDEKARKLLLQLRGKIGAKPEDLRQALLKFIGDFANWDLATDQSYLKVGRALIKAAHGDELPLVVDPFAGGGAIPLESLRLGCETFASDLNPVACLILKVMLENIPRGGLSFPDKLLRVGTDIKEAAEKQLSRFYPIDPDGARPIAYLWARTARCESPNCGAEIPLVRSFWLSKKPDRKRALRWSVEKQKSRVPFIRFEIVEPKTDADVPRRTVSNANATCPCCGIVLAAPRVRAQLAEKRGGADVTFDQHGKRNGGAILLAVVTLKRNAAGRHYRLANEKDYSAVKEAQQAVAKLPRGVVPNEPTPSGGGSGAGRAFPLRRYGLVEWGDLFTARQKLALLNLGKATLELGGDYSESVALTLGKLVDLSNALCGWIPEVECPSAVFKLGRVKTGWDFVEGATLENSSGSYSKSLDNLIAGARSAHVTAQLGQTSIQQAQSSPLPDQSAAVWFTDPPYYDAIPYSDLSDFFFVWLKRALFGNPLLQDPFDASNPLTPKDAEAVQDDLRLVNGQPKNRAFFENTMAVAFAEGMRVLNPTGIGSVVFAHKTTEGWEALLSGMIRGGWTITGSWPISTEMGHRIRARDSAALSTSVHLICRPRLDAKTGDWGQVLRELPKRVGDWMERLQNEGVRGADLVFACIGPALEIFSKHSKVETAEGREIELPEYLAKVWEVVGRTALEQILGTAEAKARNGAAGALEEDARLTALFLWTVQSTDEEADTGGQVADENGDDGESEISGGKKKKGEKLIFDVVRRFAQPLGIRLPDWEGRIIETEKGVVRLLPVRERSMQLFGEDGARGAASEIERGGDTQLVLFPDAKEIVAPRIRDRRRGTRPTEAAQKDATTLDRIHAAMLLQAGGQANALRAMLLVEQERSPDFFRLSNALSALYAKGSEEKRLLDAMLVAVPK